MPDPEQRRTDQRRSGERRSDARRSDDRWSQEWWAEERAPGSHRAEPLAAGGDGQPAGVRRRGATAVRTGPAPRVPHPSGPIEGLNRMEPGPGGPAFEELIAAPTTQDRRSARLRTRPPWHHTSRRRRVSGRRIVGRIVLAVLLPVMVVVVAGGGLLGAAYQHHPDQVKMLFGWKNDWAGAGTGSTEVVVQPGDLGDDVASTLVAQGVVKTREAFDGLLVGVRPEPTLLPGTYRLALHQSAAHALAQLQDPANRIIATLTVPEGSTLKQILSSTAASTGVPLADLTAASKRLGALGVPAGAPSLEGYLFPATYQFQPGTSAHAILQAMVTRTYQSLDAAGVAKADRARVLTLAGLVQKEGNGPDDAQVARVFLNRIAKGIPLQSDATVSYGAGGTTVVPTPAQYKARNGYNTYLRKGLPIGPISSPGDVAIRAALHPAAGKWLYFVTVDLQTGRTVFSDTEAQHEKAAAEFTKWLAAHPSYKK